MLTFQGQVTSYVMWTVDLYYAVFYTCSIDTDPLSWPAFEMFSLCVRVAILTLRLMWRHWSHDHMIRYSIAYRWFMGTDTILKFVTLTILDITPKDGALFTEYQCTFNNYVNESSPRSTFQVKVTWLQVNDVMLPLDKNTYLIGQSWVCGLCSTGSEKSRKAQVK